MCCHTWHLASSHLIISSFSMVLLQRQQTLVSTWKSVASSLGLKWFKSDPLWLLATRSGAHWTCIFLYVSSTTFATASLVRAFFLPHPWWRWPSSSDNSANTLSTRSCFFPCFGNPSWFKISLSSFILKYASLSCSRQGNDRYQSFKSNLSAWCVHEILQDSLCLIPGTKTISELSTPISHISCKEQWFWCTRKLGEAEWSTASCSRGIQCSLPITILRT